MTARPPSASIPATFSPVDELLATSTLKSSTPKTRAFWMSFVAIAVTTFLAALDLSGVGNVLPTMAKALNDEKGDFTWVGSGYALSSTAFMPLSGSLADALGRKPVMLISIGFFALGSALAGASQNMSMMIAARTVQGIGGGGILTLSEILVADLVPLSERGIYVGLIAIVWATASLLGPAIGGALASASGNAWRWLFYLNLPLTAIAAVLVILYLSVRTPPGTVRSKLAKVDWIGNAIVVVGTALAIIGLTWGGVRYPWRSAQVLAPLVIGLLLVLIFFVYELYVPQNPAVPRDIVSNRTSLSSLIAVGLHGIASIVLFQASFGATPLQAAVDFLPALFITTPSGFTASVVIAVTKKYRPANWFGWVVYIVAFALLGTAGGGTTKAKLYGYQVLAAVGTGVLYGAPMFSLLAPLPPNRAAAALALFSFTRSFTQAWGIAIGGTILQNELKRRLPAEFIGQFPAGAEIAYYSIPSIRFLEQPLRTQVEYAFEDSMAVIWRVMAGICGAGLVVSLFMKEVPMATAVDESYALEEKKKEGDKENLEPSVATEVQS
ncbi:MFS domain-containing protein [Mycena indigotica]|uniref:MFS domain-containing protein n=1 Tax=Mycena indigotica TaxID=2126181 RepID=A0A8H6TDE4_9AGAR|nr:MFS domain-containing protein [Mycena indigotica]KAF7315420.1 MFS domain-containing protein [Mycena indigotica]